jgi:hypothetical protein
MAELRVGGKVCLHTKARGGSTGCGMGSGAAATCVGAGRVRRCGRWLGGAAWTRGACGLGEQGGGMAVLGSGAWTDGPNPTSACGPADHSAVAATPARHARALERRGTTPTLPSTVQAGFLTFS